MYVNILVETMLEEKKEKEKEKGKDESKKLDKELAEATLDYISKASPKDNFTKVTAQIKTVFNKMKSSDIKVAGGSLNINEKVISAVGDDFTKFVENKKTSIKKAEPSTIKSLLNEYQKKLFTKKDGLIDTNSTIYKALVDIIDAKTVVKKDGETVQVSSITEDAKKHAISLAVKNAIEIAKISIDDGSDLVKVQQKEDTWYGGWKNFFLYLGAIVVGLLLMYISVKQSGATSSAFVSFSEVYSIASSITNLSGIWIPVFAVGAVLFAWGLWKLLKPLAIKFWNMLKSGYNKLKDKIFK